MFRRTSISVATAALALVASPALAHPHPGHNPEQGSVVSTTPAATTAPGLAGHTPEPPSPVSTGTAATTLPGLTGAVSDYDAHVLADSPVAYLPLGGTQVDLSGNGHLVTDNSSGTTTLPNGEAATTFDGRGAFVEVADSDALSIATTGQLTIECWMRPDTLNNADTEAQNYVHWLGKGGDGNGHEYTLRMYNDGGDRPNRISGYAFNARGGLGAGSYFQDDIVAGDWIHVAAVFDVGTGTVKIFRDGVLRDTDRLSDYDIAPTNEGAPLNIGTRDGNSFFAGAIGKVAVYDYDASDVIVEHAAAM